MHPVLSFFFLFFGVAAAQSLPAFLTALTRDVSGDGRIDAIDVIFSASVNATRFNASHWGLGNGRVVAGIAPASVPSTIVRVLVTPVASGYDTDAYVPISYSGPVVQSFVDNLAIDAAGPALISAVVARGGVETMVLRFSEPVVFVNVTKGVFLAGPSNSTVYAASVVEGDVVVTFGPLMGAAQAAQTTVTIGAGVVRDAANQINAARNVTAAAEPLSSVPLGARCGCSVRYDTQTNATGFARFLGGRITASCVSDAGFVPFNSLGACVCHGVVAGCLVNSVATVAEASTLDETLCDAVVPGDSLHTAPCGTSTLCRNQAGSRVSVSQSYTRYITPLPRGGGSVDTRTCTTLTTTSNCVQDALCATDPVDCVTLIGEFSPCSQTCGTGMQTAVAAVVVPPRNGGVACLTDRQRSCTGDPCPVDCLVSDWVNSSCSVTCGNGTRTQTRVVTRAPQFGGTSCPSLTQTSVCSGPTCVAGDCVYGAFGAWSACTQECGGTSSTRSRSRLIISQATGDGVPCNVSSTTEVEPCGRHVCPRDCEVSEYSAWDPCPICGGGETSRSREITQTPAGSGAACPDTLVETATCETEPCPVDCVVSPFGAFSACVGCGSVSLRTRTRTIVTYPSYGGEACPSLTESVDCTPAPCYVPCSVTNWTEWSACTVSCGGGTTTRTRQVIGAPTNVSECPPVTETLACNTLECSVDCVVSSYGNFTSCAGTCGAGTRQRIRTVTTNRSGAGVPCPALVEVQPCILPSCAPTCVAGPWSDFSSCSNGTQTRHRVVNGSGPSCPAFVETIACEMPAPVCEYDEATREFGPCTADCGPGTRDTVVYSPTVGCAPNTTTESCNDAPCPIDCEVGPFGPYGECQGGCGPGWSEATRAVLVHPFAGGAECPPLSTTRTCNTGVTCTSCNLTAWSPYSECVNGTRTRTRVVVAGPGSVCPDDTQTITCIEPPPLCTWGEFLPFSECSATCGEGITTRISPSLVDHPLCIDDVETRSCIQRDCVRSIFAYGVGLDLFAIIRVDSADVLGSGELRVTGPVPSVRNLTIANFTDSTTLTWSTPVTPGRYVVSFSDVGVVVVVHPLVTRPFVSTRGVSMETGATISPRRAEIVVPLPVETEVLRLTANGVLVGIVSTASNAVGDEVVIPITVPLSHGASYDLVVVGDEGEAEWQTFVGKYFIDSRTATPVLNVTQISQSGFGVTLTLPEDPGTECDVVASIVGTNISTLLDVGNPAAEGFLNALSLASGIYQVQASYCDSAGNPAAVVTAEISIYPATPSLTILSPADGATVARNFSLHVVLPVPAHEDSNITATARIDGDILAEGFAVFEDGTDDYDIDLVVPLRHTGEFIVVVQWRAQYSEYSTTTIALTVDNGSGSSSSDLSTGAIVGITIGAVAAVSGVVALAIRQDAHYSIING